MSVLEQIPQEYWDMTANLENTAVATELERLVFKSQRKVMLNNVQTTAQWHSSHT